jgi:excisionase family DNA binding protein
MESLYVTSPEWRVQMAAHVPNSEMVWEDCGFVTVAQAARFLNLSRAKLYQMMDAGDIAYAKFGKSRRIPRQALLRFAAQSTVVNE